MYIGCILVTLRRWVLVTLAAGDHVRGRLAAVRSPRSSFTGNLTTRGSSNKQVEIINFASSQKNLEISFSVRFMFVVNRGFIRFCPKDNILSHVIRMSSVHETIKFIVNVNILNFVMWCLRRLNYREQINYLNTFFLSTVATN